jgi:hypothetical protein
MRRSPITPSCLNRVCAVICFHNCDEMHAAAAELTEWGFEAWKLDEVDDENPSAIWIAVGISTDLDQSYFFDRMGVAIGPFHGVVVELDCVEQAP